MKDATESPALLAGRRLLRLEEEYDERSPRPRSRSSPREDLRLEIDLVSDSDLSVLSVLSDLRLLLDRTSEDERLPMRALNMMGN